MTRKVRTDAFSSNIFNLCLVESAGATHGYGGLAILLSILRESREVKYEKTQEER
jgi:hypothetical protein